MSGGGAGKEMELKLNIVTHRRVISSALVVSHTNFSTHTDPVDSYSLHCPICIVEPYFHGQFTYNTAVPKHCSILFGFVTYTSQSQMLSVSPDTATNLPKLKAVLCSAELEQNTFVVPSSLRREIMSKHYLVWVSQHR